VLLLWMVACSLGLQAVEGDVVEGDTSNAEGYPPIEDDLTGYVYLVQQDGFRISEPPDLIDYQNQIFDRPLLFYVNDQADDRLQLSMTRAATDGSQDHCEVVRSLPTGDFSTNPTFTLGPDVVKTKFAGTLAPLYRFEMEATVTEEGTSLRLGTITAVSPVEALLSAIPEADCSFIEDLGGSCTTCPGGSGDCFDLTLSALRAAWQPELAFDSRETGDCQ
jgi:hypothetical protein